MDIVDNLKDTLENALDSATESIGAALGDALGNAAESIGDAIASGTAEKISAIVGGGGGKPAEEENIMDITPETQAQTATQTETTPQEEAATQQEVIGTEAAESAHIDAQSPAATPQSPDEDLALANKKADIAKEIAEWNGAAAAVTVGFQEVCQTFRNPKFLDTVNNVSGMVTSVANNVVDTTKDILTKTLNTRLEIAKSNNERQIQRGEQLVEIAKSNNERQKYETEVQFGTQREIVNSNNATFLAAQSERNRHEEFIIREQRAILEKMIDAATHQFDSKIDFLRAQQQSLDELYKKDVSLITEHIHVLETERAKNKGDTKIYMELSDEITKLEDNKLLMKKEYRASTNKLTDTIKTLEIQMKYSQPALTQGGNLLGIGYGF